MVLMILITIRVRHGSAGDDNIAAVGGGGGGGLPESSIAGGMVEDGDKSEKSEIWFY